MRIIFKVFKWLLIVLVLVHVAAFIGFWFYGIKAKGSASKEHIAYLSSVKEVVMPQAETINSFDEAFYQNQLFFLGESHGFEVPQQLDFQLLTQLNKKTGLKYYLAEVDYSQAYFLNRYLESGDEDFLRQVFHFWTDNSAQWGNQQFYDKMKAIREYNASLPEDRKIKVLGVDLTQDLQVLKAHMNSLLTAADTSEAAKELRAYFSGDWSEIPESTVAIAEKIQESDAVYQQALGQHYFAVKHTFDNLMYKKKPVIRDSVMFLNLQTLTRAMELEDEKLYGLWGMYHSMQSSVNGTQPFAALVRQSQLPFHNKVVTLAAFTLDSEMMVPTYVIPASIRPGEKYVATSLGNFDGPLVFFYGVEDLKEVSEPNTTTLFKLDQQGSPYFGSDRLIRSTSPLGGNLQPTAPQVQVTDYFQYVFLIRNSKALSPLEAGK